MDIETALCYGFVIGVFLVLSGTVHYFVVGGTTTFNTILVLCGCLTMATVVTILSAPWLGGPRS